MSDDKSKTPALPNYMSLADDDDDDGADATVELSLKDVFQFKAQDTRSLKSSQASGIDPFQRPSAQPSEADQTVQSGQGAGIVELDGLELIPLEEDTDNELEVHPVSEESLLGGQDPTTMLDASRWRQPAQNPSQMPTRPAISALKLPDPDSTSAFEVPDTLLDQVREEAERDRQSRAFVAQKPAAAKEDDSTRAISFEELREVEALVREDDPQTAELELAELQELQLEFVAAVDENMRLFVPRHLFDEGKLKPGMRLLVTAKIIS